MATTITTLQGLQDMKDNLAEDYLLGASIDASDTSTWNGGAGFDPVGTSSTPFTGTFDGEGYGISDLTIDRLSTDNIGLFGYNTGTITRLQILSGVIKGNIGVGIVGRSTGSLTASTNGASITANNYAGGGLCGWNEGWVQTSTNTGTVTGGTSWGGYIGGICGFLNTDSARLHTSTNTGTVTGTDYIGGICGRNYGGELYRAGSTGNVSGNYYVGGGIGIHQKLSSVLATASRCMAGGNVSGNIEYTGGFVGSNAYSQIQNCYANGNVTRTGGTGTYFGGFGGITLRGITQKSYSMGAVSYTDATNPTDKGFYGYADKGGDYETTACFWDTQTSGQSTTACDATGKTTAEMQTLSTFSDAGWSIGTLAAHSGQTWYIDEDNDYPRLGWEPKPTTPPGYILRSTSGILLTEDGILLTKLP